MITIGYVLHGLEAGGIERSVTRIVNRLDREEFNPIIICLKKTGPAEAWLEQEVPVIEIGKRSGNDLQALWRFSRFLRNRRIDILQSHNWGTLVESVIARKLAGIPIHIHAERGTVMGMVQPGGWRYQLRARAMSFALARVDKVISNSNAVAVRVQDRCGYRADQIDIIPNGVPAIALDDRQQVRDQLRSQLGVASDTTLIGSVGRLVTVKGYEVAIRAIAELLSKHTKAHLVLVGDGPERQKLAELAGELGVADHVHLVGQQDNVNEWLAATDIYLNSSHSEGMSQSIIEAMAAGLPIVATDVGDTKQVLGPPDQPAGICVPAADENALANALAQLITDTNLLARLEAQSKLRHARYYTEETLTKNCQNLYRRAIGETDCGSPDGKRDHVGEVQ